MEPRSALPRSALPRRRRPGGERAAARHVAAVRVADRPRWGDVLTDPFGAGARRAVDLWLEAGLVAHLQAIAGPDVAADYGRLLAAGWVGRTSSGPKSTGLLGQHHYSPRPGVHTIGPCGCRSALRAPRGPPGQFGKCRERTRHKYAT